MQLKQNNWGKNKNIRIICIKFDEINIWVIRLYPIQC